MSSSLARPHVVAPTSPRVPRSKSPLVRRQVVGMQVGQVPHAHHPTQPQPQAQAKQHPQPSQPSQPSPTSQTSHPPQPPQPAQLQTQEHHQARPSRPVRRLDAAHNVTSIAAPSSARTPGSFVEQPMEHKTPLGIASMASATSTSNQSHSGGVPEEFKATLSRLEEAFARRTFDLENFVKQKVNELTAASTLNSCGDRMKQTTSDLERRCDDMQEALRQLQQKDLTSVAARCEQLESDIAMVRSEHELLQQEQHRKWEVSNVAFGALQNDWENNFKASFADLRQEMEHMKVQSEDVCSEMIQMQRRSDLVSEDTKCLKEKLSRVELSLEQLQDGRRDNIEGDTIKSAMKEVNVT